MCMCSSQWTSRRSEMGPREWMSMELMDVFKCSCLWSFRISQVGSGAWMSLGRIDVFICSLQRTSSRSQVGSREWVSLGSRLLSEIYNLFSSQRLDSSTSVSNN